MEWKNLPSPGADKLYAFRKIFQLFVSPSQIKPVGAVCSKWREIREHFIEDVKNLSPFYFLIYIFFLKM